MRPAGRKGGEDKDALAPQSTTAKTVPRLPVNVKRRVQCGREKRKIVGGPFL